MRSIPALQLFAITACLCFANGSLDMARASIVETLTERTTSEKFTRLADARSYRHCHNIHTRVYCHKGDRLPVNWPPHSDTPRQDRIGSSNSIEFPAAVKQKPVLK